MFEAAAYERFGLYLAGGALVVATAAASTFAKQLGSVLVSRMTKITIHGVEVEPSRELATEPLRKPRFELAKKQVVRRLEEARELQVRKTSSAKVSKLSAGLLTFAQYIIGGVLASSFVQQETSPAVIGLFGVLVLLASLVSQHFHPEASAQTAALKADQIGALIREAEDRIVVIEAKSSAEDDPQAVLDLLERISAQLNAITLTPSVPASATKPS